MTFNAGVIIGPLLGGFLAEPATSFPSLFGPGSTFGGRDGVQWMMDYPYLLPNLVCASFLFLAVVDVILLLDETHPTRVHKRDRGRELGRFISKTLFRKGQTKQEYEAVSNDETSALLSNSPHSEEDGETRREPSDPKPPASLRALCNRKLAFSILQNSVMTLHVSAFNSMLFVLLPANRVPAGDPTHHGLLTGGLGLSPQKIGLASTIIGFIGFPLQILLFPWVSAKLGVLRCYLIFLPFGALSYLSLPWLTLVAGRDGILWPCLALTLSLQVLSRTFVVPATMLLVNEAAPDQTLLGTVHGIASSASAGARVIGPAVGAAMLGWGLHHDLVGVPFWMVSFLAVVNWVIVWSLDEVRLS